MPKKNQMHTALRVFHERHIRALAKCAYEEIRYVIACSKQDCGHEITFDEWTATQLAEQAHYQGWSVGPHGFALCPECGDKDE